MDEPGHVHKIMHTQGELPANSSQKIKQKGRNWLKRGKKEGRVRSGRKIKRKMKNRGKKGKRGRKET